MGKKEKYIDFLYSKIKVAKKHGIKLSPSVLHPSTKPHQRDIICWSAELGASLIAADCGLGKTHIIIELLRALLMQSSGQKALIVTELGASDTFCNPDPEVGEGARLGVNLEYIKNTDEALQSNCNIVVTNYERVRMGDIDFSKFFVVGLDEGNYIKNMASETTNALAKQLEKVKYKYIATATPSPNEALELVNYAHVLGICDRGQILTQFFQRNSTKAGDLTLHPQHESDFWLWVYSWMVAIESPSDLGYSDEGYDLPELEVVWHEVKSGIAFDAGFEKDGQAKMFISTGNNLPDNAKIKRESIALRVDKALEIMTSYENNEHFILWHHLEDERKALYHVFDQQFDNISYGDLYGAQSIELKEKRIVDFTKGYLQILATKPSISGVGCNFQKHCHVAILIGVNNDFNLFYQMLKRIHRFGQKQKCIFHVIYLPEEYAIVQNIKRKWKQHKEQRQWLRNFVRKFGLDHTKMIDERKRSFKIDRKEYVGKNFKLVCTDNVFEWQNLESNTFDFMNSSFPFGNHYEYTNLYNDFGHNTTNKDFLKQLDFLLPELYRTLKPGRIITVHLKNRIHYGSVTGLGFSIFHRFTHLICDAMEKHGFYTMGFHYIPTDVVAENNQTYRLTYGEMLKDATKMGSGIPEEIWIFRKPPTSNLNAYADFPVTKNDIDYSLSRWQIDADSFWKSNGNRLLTPLELKARNLSKVRGWWNVFDKSHIYDYDGHIELLEALDQEDKLSRTFTTLPFQSNSEYIWSNVNRMQGLNMEQYRRRQQNHICPQPFDEVDRCIEFYSNEGDYIADPFGGLGTTGVRGLKKKRKVFMTELNSYYAECNYRYLKETEYKNTIPTLFDALDTVA